MIIIKQNVDLRAALAFSDSLPFFKFHGIRNSTQ